MDADPERETFSTLVQPIVDRPALYPHLLLAYSGFETLSSSRSVGFGLGAIPFSEMVTYCAWVGFTDRDEQEWLIRRIQMLDSEYLRLVNEERKEEDDLRKQETEQKEDARKKAAL